MLYLQEEWRPFPTLEERYEISDLGRCRRKSDQLILKPQYRSKSSKGNYMFFEVSKDNVKIRKSAHRAVAIAFLPRIEGKNLVNHRDGNKYNNQVSNLEWVNDKENAQHAIYMGLNQCLGSPVLSKEQFTSIREEYSTFVTNLAKQHSVTESIVKSAIRGKVYKSHQQE